MGMGKGRKGKEEERNGEGNWKGEEELKVKEKGGEKGKKGNRMRKERAKNMGREVKGKGN